MECCGFIINFFFQWKNSQKVKMLIHLYCVIRFLRFDTKCLKTKRKSNEQRETTSWTRRYVNKMIFPTRYGHSKNPVSHVSSYFIYLFLSVSLSLVVVVVVVVMCQMMAMGGKERVTHILSLLSYWLLKNVNRISLDCTKVFGFFFCLSFYIDRWLR